MVCTEVNMVSTYDCTCNITQVGCGRRLVTGSCVICETTPTGCPRSRRAFLYLSIYLSISLGTLDLLTMEISDAQGNAMRKQCAMRDAEAMRLLGLAAAQGDADAQAHLGRMYCLGQGRRPDLAEAMRLLGLTAAAQGYAEAQAHLACIQLLTEDAEEKKANGAPKSAKSAKSKKSRASAAPPSAAAPAAPHTPPSSGATAAETAAASDTAMRDAMTAGELEGLSTALEVHRLLASEDVLREARSLRDRLKERRKQKSQRQRRSHAGAMEALLQLQGCAAEADALRAGIAVAEAHAGELPALDTARAACRMCTAGGAIDGPSV